MQSSQAGPRIVIGVDGAGHADHAVHLGFLLARAVHGDVELVHAPEVPHHFWEHVEPQALAAAEQRTVERLAAVLADLAVDRDELRRRLAVREGSPAQAILERAEGAAWIVLGSHRPESTLDFGDNVRAVLARAGCPVWVQAGPVRAPRKVVAAVDLSEASRRVMAVARDIALAFGAELELLHAFVRPDLGYVLGYPVPFPKSVIERARAAAEEEFEHLSKAIDWDGLHPAARFVEGDPVAEILAAQESADLVVLGTQGHTALLGAILGGVSRRVLAEARRPVVVVREH